MTGGELGVGVVKTAAPLIKPIGGWLGRQIRPDISRTSLNTLADDLADAVARSERLLLDQLRAGPDALMDIDFQAVSLFRTEARTTSYALSEIGTFLQDHPSPQRLIIIGEAGAGKTVLAIHLLLQQLRHRASQSDSLRAETHRCPSASMPRGGTVAAISPTGWPAVWEVLTDCAHG